ncbi:hypothetical protein [Aphanothece sacrum]|uniref:Uridine phosphorylase n=1 Tax=Aphanothece sacrum FPU1 TaxID=1920663 RepID=A0A401IMZ0_APHSA|nr:hypothetical protein [Aphanothece sacrum]GBF82598.1 uridine phosphorylase [Aphanothece sacrum FPU1]GBF84732.1 uridine phosphorylase [Aphanothece sacrum FPU3]
MTLTKISSRSQQKSSGMRLWFEKIMALLILLNYVVVIFDLTYIPLRDFWLQGRVQLYIKFGTFEKEIPDPPLQILPNFISKVIQKYDLIKGIEPHRDTKKYLELVDNLNNAINLTINQQSFSSSKSYNTKASDQESIDSILADLRRRSTEMIEQNPFQIANKTGTLERIKDKMRKHISDNRESSAKEAFNTFWSQEYLSQKGWRSQLNFFDEEIRPLIATNYFRPVGQNGEMINNFGLIDFPFSLFFLLEFLGRTFLISRRYTGVSWFDAMLWRWYDIFLIIPFIRWLRIIPLTIRLDQAKLIDLKAIKKQASQGFIAGIAQDLTEVLAIQIINQIQSSIIDGSVRNLVLQRNVNQYIDINDLDEITELIKLAANIVINKVLPEISSEAEAFLLYNFEKALTQSPGYQGLENIPGFKSLQIQVTERLVSQLYQNLSAGLQGLLVEDYRFNELLKILVEKFRTSMANGLQKEHSMEQIESLLNDFLEEIKLNYVQSLSQEDVEDILEQTRALRKSANNKIEQL